MTLYCSKHSKLHTTVLYNKENWFLWCTSLRRVPISTCWRLACALWVHLSNSFISWNASSISILFAAGFLFAVDCFYLLEKRVSFYWSLIFFLIVVWKPMWFFGAFLDRGKMIAAMISLILRFWCASLVAVMFRPRKSTWLTPKIVRPRFVSNPRFVHSFKLFWGFQSVVECHLWLHQCCPRFQAVSRYAHLKPQTGDMLVDKKSCLLVGPIYMDKIQLAQLNASVSAADWFAMC